MRRPLLMLLALLIFWQPVLPLIAAPRQSYFPTKSTEIDAQEMIDDLLAANAVGMDNTTAEVTTEWQDFGGLSVSLSSQELDFKVNEVDNGAFHLTAPVRHFDTPMVIRIPSSTPTTLVREMPFGKPEIRPSSYSEQEQMVFATIAEPGVYRLAAQTGCSPEVGQGAPAAVGIAFVSGYESRGGQAALGCPTSAVFNVGTIGTYLQWFNDKVLVYNPNEEAVYLLDHDIFGVYSNAASWLGYPRSDVFSGAPSGKIWKDQFSDFSGGRLALFSKKGFVGENSLKGNAIEAHLYFPNAPRVAVRYNNKIVGYDGETPIYRVAIELDFETRTYTTSGEVVESISYNVVGGPVRSEKGQVFKLVNPADSRGFEPGTTIEFLHLVSRFSPDTQLTGYFPCDFLDTLTQYQFTVPMPAGEGQTSEKLLNGCGLADDGEGGELDNTPPVIKNVRVYNTHTYTKTNSLAIQATIEDETMMGSAMMVPTVGSPQDMVPFRTLNAKRNGIYEAIVHGASINTGLAFTIIARDAAGNIATKSYTYFNGILRVSPYCLLPDCKTAAQYLYGVDNNRQYMASSGNPIMTQNGNKTEEFPLIAYPGPGAAAIDLALTLNSQSAVSGYFGSGVASDIDVSLNLFDNSLFSGARIAYPGGGVGDFAASGECNFTPMTDGVYDKFECDGNGGYRLTTINREVYEFNALGQLTALADLNGNKVMLVYDGEGRPTQLVSSSGRSVTLTYNADNLITNLSGTGGKQITLQYTGMRLDSVTDADGGVWKFTYDERPLGVILDDNGNEKTATWYLLKSVTTPEGRTKNYQDYDEFGRAIFQRIGETETRQYIYDDAAHSTTIIDANGRTEVHQYDEEGRLISRRDAAGSSETYSYTDHFVTGYTNHNGQSWTYTVDDRGNRLTVAGPEGMNEAWQYNSFNQVIHYRDSEGREVKFEYDAQGNLVKVIDPAGNQQTITRNAQGLPTEIVDFAGRRETMTYNAAGDLLTSSNGLNNTTTFAYYDTGLVQTRTNPNGDSYTFTYDHRDNLLRADGPLGWSQRSEFDKDGNLIKEINALGGETVYTLDTSARLTKICDPENRCLLQEYEVMGHLIKVVDSKNRAIVYTLNEKYEVVQIAAPENTTYKIAYDKVGNVIARIDPLERVSRFNYDGLNRLIEQILNYKEGAASAADVNVNTRFSYDRVGNLLSVTDAENNTTTFEYNVLNQQIVRRDALNRETRYRYTPVGDLTELRNPRGFATTFTYDAAAQLATIVDAKNGTTRFIYDGNGNTTEVHNARSVITRSEFNLLNQRIKQIENYKPGFAVTSDTNVETTYRFDLLGNMTGLTDARGFSATYTYNAVSELIGIVDRVNATTTLTRDNAGNIIAITDGNNHVTGFVLDGLDRVTEEINPEGHKRLYSYDKVGNVLTFTNERSFIETRTYDGLDRMVSLLDFDEGVWTQQFDRVGNILAETDANLHTRRYEYNDVYEMIRAIDAKGEDSLLAYDENSNLIRYQDREDNATLYTYDELDRQIAIQDALSRTTTMTYDPVSNLIAVTAPDMVVTQYNFDPLNRLSSVLENFVPAAMPTNNVNVQTAYGYTPTGLLERITNPNNAVTTFTHDGEGRVISEVDPLQNTWDYVFDPVGNLINRTDANRDQTLYTYYPDDQLRSIAYPDGTAVQFTYDPANNRILMEEPGRGLAPSKWKYDPLNRVKRQVDGFGRKLWMKYDAVGNRTALLYPDKTKVSYSFDENDWLSSVDIPKQGTTAYERNKEGYITRIHYPNFTRSRMTYDAAYQLLSVKHKQTRAPHDIISAQRYQYDLAGQRFHAAYTYGWRQPEKVQVTYTYDNLRRLVSSLDDGGVSTSYGYDAAGNRLSWVTNDDPMTSIPFDAFNETFTYNSANQLLGAMRAYNGAINPTTTPVVPTLTAATEVPTLTPVVPTNEAPTTTSVVPTVEVPTLTPEIPTVEAPTATPELPTATFTPEIPTETPSPTATPTPTLDSLLAAVQTYCASGLITGMCNGLETKIQQAITDAANGNLSAVVQHLEGFKHQIQVQEDGQVDPYAASDLIAQADYLIGIYGALPTSEPIVIETLEMKPTSDQPTREPETFRGMSSVQTVSNSWLQLPAAQAPLEPSQGGGSVNNPAGYSASFQYDPNGSRTNSHYWYTNGQEYTTNYSYDFERRLTQIDEYQIVGSAPNEQERGITTYLYDGLGARMRHIYHRQSDSNQFTTEFVNDGWDTVATYDMQTPQFTFYFRDDQQNILSSRDMWINGKGAHRWYHNDGLGSVSALTKHNGNSVHTYRYDAYGAITPGQNQSNSDGNGTFVDPHNNFTYSGKLYDPETGLHFYGSRYYDSQMAQWISQDTFRGVPTVPQSLHRYAFVHDNPMNNVDWYGFSSSSPQPSRANSSVQTNQSTQANQQSTSQQSSVNSSVQTNQSIQSNQQPTPQPSRANSQYTQMATPNYGYGICPAPNGSTQPNQKPVCLLVNFWQCDIGISAKGEGLVTIGVGVGGEVGGRFKVFGPNAGDITQYGAVSGNVGGATDANGSLCLFLGDAGDLSAGVAGDVGAGGHGGADISIGAGGLEVEACLGLGAGAGGTGYVKVEKEKPVFNLYSAIGSAYRNTVEGIQEIKREFNRLNDPQTWAKCAPYGCFHW